VLSGRSRHQKKGRGRFKRESSQENQEEKYGGGSTNILGSKGGGRRVIGRGKGKSKERKRGGKINEKEGSHKHGGEKDIKEIMVGLTLNFRVGEKKKRGCSGNDLFGDILMVFD